DARGDYVDQAAPQLATLAQEAHRAPELLAAELTWVVTDRAHHGFVFGRELGKRDSDASHWPAIVTAWKADALRSDFFVGGYLSAFKAHDQNKWNQLLEGIAADPDLCQSYARVMWRSGVNEQAVLTLLALIKARKVAVIDLRLFVYGAAIREFVKPDF